jgi:hypothetical protein
MALTNAANCVTFGMKSHEDEKKEIGSASYAIASFSWLNEAENDNLQTPFYGVFL